MRISDWSSDVCSSDLKTFDTYERAFNADLYAENRFFVTETVAMVLGGQFGWSKRKADDRFLADGDHSGTDDYTYLNPKLGLIWDVDPTWQIFGNISRSTEPPTFSDLSPTAGAGYADIDPQKATTLEIGTRGRRPDSRWEWGWDVAVYRAWLRDEIQLFDLGGGMNRAANADRTVHQGVEIGFDVTVAKGLFVGGDRQRTLLNSSH